MGPFYRIRKGSFVHVHGDWSNISGYLQAGFGGMGAAHSIGLLQCSRCVWSKWLQRLLKSKAQQPSQAYMPWHVFQAVRAEIYNSDTTHKLRFRMKEDVILVFINIAFFCLNLDMSFHIHVSYPTDLMDIGPWCLEKNISTGPFVRMCFLWCTCASLGQRCAPQGWCVKPRIIDWHSLLDIPWSMNLHWSCQDEGG